MSAPAGTAQAPRRRLRIPPALRSAQKWRLASGLVLFVFSLTHFLNHALGLVSPEAMQAAQVWRTAFWNGPAGIVLYGAFAVHIGLALWKLATRTTWRMPAWEAAQIALGLSIPFWLAAHIVGTRVIGTRNGFDYSYDNVLRLLWPDLAFSQSALLVVVWVHAMIGLHHWLKLMRWYRAWAPWLLGLAVLVPALSIAGWINAARAVALRPPPETLLTPAMIEASVRYLDQVTAGLSALALATVTALVARFARRRLVRGATVTYAGGRSARAPAGATLLDVARANGIAHAAVCGGRGRCSTCRVQVLKGAETLDPPGSIEAAALARIGAPEGVRLACQIRPRDDLLVRPLVPVAQAPAGTVGDAYRWGVERRITVMFADLRGFTTLSEKLYPYDTVFLLNRYLEAMAQVIRDRGGTVDKFMGDGIMALFGVDPAPGAGARDALLAARDMGAAIAAINAEFAATLPEKLRIGIGIHQGQAILGRVGATSVDGRAALTALGDTVNIASRLESLNKEYGSTLVISDAALSAAGLAVDGGESREADVRGRAERVLVHAFHRLDGIGDPLRPAA